MRSTYLGIDSGTQSTKALLVDESGQVIGRGQAAYDVIPDLPVGTKEQHPQTWVDAMVQAVREALKSAAVDPASVRAIGVSGQQHGFVALDSEGRVIRPAKLWCDTSTQPEAEELLSIAGGPERFLQHTGNSLPPGYTASKILWLKRHEPENFARLATVLLPHDYLNWWLTGEAKMEYGDASGTALLDVRTRTWAREVIDAIDPRLHACLPPLIHSADLCGRLRPQAARALGLPPGIAVSAGGGDNMMGAIGTGNVCPGIVTISLGTSGTVYACSDHPIVDERHGEIAAFCDSTGKWLPLICTMNVTVATELVKRSFQLGNKEIEEAARGVPPGSNGLLLLPYFEGERTPNYPDGTGVWFGYSARTHTPGHFARAAMEGAALGLRYGFDQLRAKGVVPSEIRLTGGGSKNPLWRQIIADAFATPVVCTSEPEGAALGAAIQAAWALQRSEGASADLVSLCERFVQIDNATRCAPDPHAARIYEELLQLHEQLPPSLRAVFARHQEWLQKHEG